MYIYGLVNKLTGELIDICLGTEATQEMNMNNKDKDLQIQPVMLYSEYEKQPIDYRSTVEGVRYLLYMGIDGKTTYGPVALLVHWGSWFRKLQIATEAAGMKGCRC